MKEASEIFGSYYNLKLKISLIARLLKIEFGYQIQAEIAAHSPHLKLRALYNNQYIINYRQASSLLHALFSIRNSKILYLDFYIITLATQLQANLQYD